MFSQLIDCREHLAAHFAHGFISVLLRGNLGILGNLLGSFLPRVKFLLVLDHRRLLGEFLSARLATERRQLEVNRGHVGSSHGLRKKSLFTDEAQKLCLCRKFRIVFVQLFDAFFNSRILVTFFSLSAKLFLMSLKT